MGLPLLLSTVLGNGLILVGYYVMLNGVLDFMNIQKRSSRTFFLIFIVIFGLAIAYYTYFQNNFMIRVLIASLPLFVFDALGVWAFWPRGKHRRYVASIILIVGFGGHGLLFLARTIWAMASVIGSPLIGTQAVMDAATLSAIATPVLLAMGFLAISNESLLKQVQAQAARDPLTGVYNRRAFMTIAEHIWKRCRREACRVSVLTIDLDHFKTVNDTHGHAVGDEALRHVVTLVADVLRSNDPLARFGGEEFVVLLADTDRDRALAVAERIRQAVESSPMPLRDGTTLHLTASIGLVSTVPEDPHHTIDQAIDQADQALYRAKACGRNRVCGAEGPEPVGEPPTGRDQHIPVTLPTPPPSGPPRS